MGAHPRLGEQSLLRLVRDSKLMDAVLAAV